MFDASAFDGNSSLCRCPRKPTWQGDEKHIDGGGEENYDDKQVSNGTNAFTRIRFPFYLSIFDASSSFYMHSYAHKAFVWWKGFDVLDLSYNNFPGRTPSGSQTGTFNASAFAGSPALCGLPLTPTCQGDEKPTVGGVKYNQDEEGEFWRGFKPCMDLEMAFSFVGVLAFKLDHPWKHFCSLPFNSMKICLSNLKDFFLCLIVAALCLVVTVNAVRLRRKFKF
ncbi:hypothetical protein SLEP1_g39169 [Rubroshorea leprosula]|uniref:Uncharacterized protein n=1 Tax=Rubroshorea leprosula TaxID=152421 RepID=A0AAV5KZU6_9ROSI|nr:hypothetical protein SLEP1_g39169 [Rubroshorea leprosula]